MSFQQKITEIVKDKKDKNGNPYFFRLISVRNILIEKMGRYSYKHCVAAMLYDVIVNCDYGIDEIKSKFELDLREVVRHYHDDTISEKIIDMVASLLKSDSETYEEYIDRIIDEGNDVVVIKVCDIMNAMKEQKKLNASEQEIEAMKQYRKAYNKLNGVIERW